MNKHFFIVSIFFLSIFFFYGWPDADAYGTFNFFCNDGPMIQVPFLSSFVFSLIPCSFFLFKAFQFLLLLIILFVISRFYPLWLLGYVSFFSVFLLSLEDDLLAVPLLLIMGFILTKEKKHFFSWLTSFNFAIISLFLGFFVWKGAFLIGGVLTAFSIHPFLSIPVVFAYALHNGISTWGSSSEAIMGTGFLVGQIGFFLWLFLIYKNRFFEWDNRFFLLISLEFLAFFQPKWGEWLILIVFPLLYDQIVLLDINKQKMIKFFGLFMIFLVIIFQLITMIPTTKQWEIIEQAKKIQEKGGNVYNEWGVGHYFSFIGGKPSQWGGCCGKTPDQNFYWLGTKRNCETINSGDRLFLQKC